MVAYLGRRLLGTFVMLVGLAVGTFVLTRVLPADPARVAAGTRATPEQVAEVSRQMGLDQSLWNQFLKYGADLVRGDFGYSFVSHRSVSTDILQFFPATLELVFWAMILMTCIGVPVGIFSALGSGRMARNLVKMSTFAAMGVPAFVLALIAQIVFFGELGWFPAGGRLDNIDGTTITNIYTLDAILTGNTEFLKSVLWHLALPALSLAVYRAGMVSRFTESEVLRVMDSDYIRTAKAKGVPARRILTSHVAQNAAAPILSIIGLEFGWLLGGSVLVEAIFSWPGMGTYILKSVEAFDFNPVIMCVLVLGLSFALINLMVDFAQALIDPRVGLK